MSDSPPLETTTAAAGEATRTVLHQFADLLDGVSDDRLGDPTPCTEFSVADLRDHVVGWALAFGAGFCDPGGQAPDPDAFEIEGSGGDQLRRAGDAIATGVAGGGAQRPLTLADGASMPGDLALGMTLWEYQVHGWDLARALGRDWAPAAEAVEGSIAFAGQMLTPDWQGEGKSFAPRVPVPEDAPAIDRLVGLSGRDPQWTPPA